eukprot:743482-Alexandrium_andersonii.AAC.1
MTVGVFHRKSRARIHGVARRVAIWTAPPPIAVAPLGPGPGRAAAARISTADCTPSVRSADADENRREAELRS